MRMPVHGPVAIMRLSQGSEIVDPSSCLASTSLTRLFSVDIEVALAWMNCAPFSFANSSNEVVSKYGSLS